MRFAVFIGLEVFFRGVVRVGRRRVVRVRVWGRLFVVFVIRVFRVSFVAVCCT